MLRVAKLPICYELPASENGMAKEKEYSDPETDKTYS